MVSDRAKELQKDELAKQNTITWNTENGEPPPADQLAWSDVWKMTKPGDLLTVHKMPCAREGYMTGIVSGAAMGALRLVLGCKEPCLSPFPRFSGTRALGGQTAVRPADDRG